jgi:sRNA-binding protein
LRRHASAIVANVHGLVGRCELVRLERRRRPLKIGISYDILARLGDQLDREPLGRALRYYTRNTFYRMSQQPGAPRIDLDGNESGTVSEADAASAAKDVAWRTKAAAAAKKQQTVRPPPIDEVSSRGAAIEPKLTSEIVSAPLSPPEPPKRPASLSDLREAAKRRKAMAMA